MIHYLSLFNYFFFQVLFLVLTFETNSSVVKVLLAEEVTALGRSTANVDPDPPLNGVREATSCRKQRQYIKNGPRFPLACWDHARAHHSS